MPGSVLNLLFAQPAGTMTFFRQSRFGGVTENAQRPLGRETTSPDMVGKPIHLIP